MISPTESDIVGNSPGIRRLRQDIRRCAASSSPVLITGEAGVGKELCARTLHGLGSRQDAPFLVVNCAAFTSALLKSELFGHEMGACEGAPRRRAGRCQEVGTGTLYLDEVAEMSLETQRKLSRAIGEGCFRPLGGRRLQPLRARIIAASSRDLAREVRERRFLQTLLLQLNVLPLRLPPLRELLGVIENALVHCEGGNLGPEHSRLLVSEEYAGFSYDEAKSIALESFQRAYVTPILRATHGSIGKACVLMDLPRQTLHRIMRKLDLRKEQFREPRSAPRPASPRKRRT